MLEKVQEGKGPKFRFKPMPKLKYYKMCLKLKH